MLWETVLTIPCIGTDEGAERWAMALAYWVQLVKLCVKVTTLISYIFDVWLPRPCNETTKRALPLQVIGQNVDKPKRPQPERQHTGTSTNQNVYKPKRQYTAKFVPFMSFQYYHMLN